jgi:hypothetical protein
MEALLSALIELDQVTKRRRFAEDAL